MAVDGVAGFVQKSVFGIVIEISMQYMFFHLISIKSEHLEVAFFIIKRPKLNY